MGVLGPQPPFYRQQLQKVLVQAIGEPELLELLAQQLQGVGVDGPPQGAVLGHFLVLLVLVDLPRLVSSLLKPWVVLLVWVAKPLLIPKHVQFRFLQEEAFLAIDLLFQIGQEPPTE